MDKKRLLFSCVLVGILLRFIFMPFTLHPDILHIYYHPHFLPSKGIWDIYTYHADFFKEHHYHYYAPLTYIFFGSYLYLIQPLSAGFDEFMQMVRKVTDQGGGHSGHYLIEASTPVLFRFLFLMKLPYLFFDLGLLGLLIMFNKSFSHDLWRERLMKWWALNPILIYVSYLLGQFDIIPTFFILLATYFAFNEKKTISMICLGVGGALKGFPLFLIFPFSFYLGKNIKGIIKYIFLGILPLLIIVGPFYILTQGEVIGTFFSHRISERLGVTDNWGVIRATIFILGYIFLCLSLLKKTFKERLGRLWPVKLSFFTLTLLFISFPISFHYFLWITPFILILGLNLRFRIMPIYLLAVFSLVISALIGKNMWMGLFSPIYPEFFMGLPGLDEIIKRFLLFIYVKRITSFVFTGALVWMGVLVWKNGISKCKIEKT